MKKIVLLVASVALMVSAASAQGFGWGVKAGANFANLTNAPSGYGSMVGFTGGVFADYKFGSVIAVSADLLYSAQGTNHDKDNKTTLSYLNLPILANFYITEGFAVKAGLQPGFMLGAASTIEGEKTTGTDGYKTFDLTLPVGLSYEFPMGLIVDARYGIGMTKVFDGEDAGKFKNSVFSLTLGYRF